MAKFNTSKHGMCHFIFLILPAKADCAAVGAVCERHERAFRPVDSSKIVSPFLVEGERMYLTTAGHCDCGTPLIPRREDYFVQHNQDHMLVQRAEKLRKDGWKQHKIANWLAQKTALRDKKLQNRNEENKQEINRWHELLSATLDQKLSPYVGLIVLWDDKNTCIKTRIARKLRPDFAPLAENTIYIFS